MARIAIPVRATNSLLLASAMAVACSQMLGIDGQYAPVEETRGAGGSGEVRDAGKGGMSESVPPDMPMASNGGSGGEGVVPPPFEETGGAPVPPLTDVKCPPGEKWCGECLAQEPSVGCNAASCAACSESDSHGVAVCGSDGACELRCNDGYVKDGARCTPLPMGAGGSVGGSGGATGSGGTTGTGGADTGTGGRPPPCDPLECPACNRGFEGCCIPAAPGMPSRCGCFYFPPLCTARVG